MLCTNYRYIRGRLKIRKINDGVNELNDLVLNKYKVLRKQMKQKLALMYF